MTAEDLERNYIPHLRDQFSRARPVLFTGAGFSASAMNIEGRAVPSVSALKETLWKMCFPGVPYDPISNLQDLYEAATVQFPDDVKAYFGREFTVEPATLPDWYAEILNLPWQRAYTLNVDDLPLAISARFPMARPIAAVSATSGAVNTTSATDLEFVYLNGTLADVPQLVTFSATQYAERIAHADPWYMRLVGELLTSPFVFVGSSLDEPPLWQHVAMRQSKGPRASRELRHRSYLVAPTLGRARESRLHELNIVWLPMTAEEFVHNIIHRIGSGLRQGFGAIAERAGGRGGQPHRISEVAELAVHPHAQHEYLLGEEPIWADIQSERAIIRSIDEALHRQAQTALSSRALPQLIFVTGTAASGKSTTLMRECLKLTSQGTAVAWIDRTSNVSRADVRADLNREGSPLVLAIDDVDMYGSEAAPLLSDALAAEPPRLVLAAARSSRLQRMVYNPILSGRRIQEIIMPTLQDDEIARLVDLLAREHRLGQLTGLSRADQEKALRDRAGRQLLVAMWEATHGKRFEEKVIEEFDQLDGKAQLAYSAVSLASAHRFGLFRDEILLATGDTSNEMLNVVDDLVRRHILHTGTEQLVWARHRVIAEQVRDELARRGQLGGAINGLVFVAAAKLLPTRRQGREWRMLQLFMNHNFLKQFAPTLTFARQLYAENEPHLGWDYHYWLQRGSLEVEDGSNLSLAELYLATARGLGPGDHLVDTEWAYLLFRKAWDAPTSGDASKWVEEAVTILESLIAGGNDPYPFHVLGSQAIAWSRRGPMTSQARERFLRGVRRSVDDGLRKFPWSSDIQQLAEDLKREYLAIAQVK